MESLLPLFFVVIILLTIVLSSFLAKTFKAKRHQPYWMVLPWVVAFLAVITANIFQLDGLYAVGIGLSVFMLSLEMINGMKFSSAATITVTTLATLALSFVGIGYALNQSGTHTQAFTANVLSFIPQSQFYNLSFLEEIDKKKSGILDEVGESLVNYSENDLLPRKVIKKRIIKSTVYSEVSPKKAGSLLGSKFRLLRSDGKILKGNIMGLEGNKLVISKYIPSKGMIQARIHLDLIKKFEVLKQRR